PAAAAPAVGAKKKTTQAPKAKKSKPVARHFAPLVAGAGGGSGWATKEDARGSKKGKAGKLQPGSTEAPAAAASSAVDLASVAGGNGGASG
ncbi:unnamed protein product, partial [Ectocarpus fasciculatus]